MEEQQYKWKIKYTLKNGAEMWGLYIGPESDSRGVIGTLLGPGGDWVGTYGANEKHQLLVKISEIAAIDISQFTQS